MTGRTSSGADAPEDASRGPEFAPIADYGMLADCHTAALVSRAGSIDWLCLPHYDSPAVFARLLDPDAGHWSIRPAAGYTAERRYLPGTLVIETTFTTTDGVVRLTDALGVVEGQRGHDLGRDAPHEVLRSLEGLEGRVEMVMELAPRPEYGLVRPLCRATHDGGRTFGGPGQISLSAGVPVAVRDATMRAGFAIDASASVGFCLTWAPAESAPPTTCSPSRVRERVADTAQAWRSWEAEHDVYEGPHHDLVLLSSRVLKGLSYRPTGAIVAAPTTSLPERVGGERNWDYRYAWIRDASLTLQALYIGTCPDEASHFISYMTSAAGGHAGDESALQIMYGIRGEHDLSERELGHLRGWRDSRPVRVGNGAWNQIQLDVYGQLLDAIHLYRDRLGELHPEIQCFVADLAERRLAGGASRMPACGRCAGSPATTCRPRSCAGWHWTARSGWGHAWASTPASRHGRRRATPSAMRSSNTAGAPSARPSSSRSAPASWTPRRCRCRWSDSCRPRTGGCARRSRRSPAN